MNGLAPSFQGRAAFSPNVAYRLLPCRFGTLDEGRSIVSSLGGEHLVVPTPVLRDFLEHRLPIDSMWFPEFESRHLLYTDDFALKAEILAAQYRTRQSLLPNGAALHIFVVTLRCDNACQYCQVSRVSEDRSAFDMTEATASRAIDLMLSGPSPTLKVEFQGGESLLNFPLIRYIVNETKRRAAGRAVEFVVATNLAPLTDEMLLFFRENRVFVSTSIDGPAALHNRNRPRPTGDAYERAVEGIVRCRKALGPDSVSALMTCTASSLEQPESIVDEYVKLGFREIFLRSVSPYGFAAKSQKLLGYETARFLEFYRRALRRIIEHNVDGVAIKEVYASILLSRILSSFPTGFVDLQSPSGIGLSVMVYNYDGDVYPSDEARMLAEMGDKRFRLGSVHRHSWGELFVESDLLSVLSETMTEGLPGCADCVFQPYCGSDPVRHHATQGDSTGHRPTSSFCAKQKGLFELLIRLLEDDSVAAPVLKRWVA